MQQATQTQENYMTAAAWAEAHGYSPDQVRYMCTTRQLEFVIRSGKRWIKDCSTPKKIQLSGWITIKEFAEIHKISASLVRNLILKRKLQTKRVCGRTLVWAETQLIQKERFSAFSKTRCVYWEAVPVQ